MELVKPVILSIDDNRANQTLIRKSLQQQYNVIQAMSGEEGIQLAVDIEPDLILLDVHMPDMDGYETCSKIRSTENIHDVPILFVSCLSELSNRLRGYDAGGDDYLVKPVDLQELKSKIGVTLQRHKKTATPHASQPQISYKLQNLSLKLQATDTQAQESLQSISHQLRYMRQPIQQFIAGAYQEQIVAIENQIDQVADQLSGAHKKIQNDLARIESQFNDPINHH